MGPEEKVQRAPKIRLNPSAGQTQWLLEACGVARFCYNWGLERWREQYEAGEEPSAYKLKKQLRLRGLTVRSSQLRFPRMQDIGMLP